MRVKHAAKIVTDPLTNTGRDVLLRVGADSIQQRDDYHGPTREVQNLMWFCPCSPANQGVQPSVRRPMANNIVWVLQSDRSERSVPYRNISVNRKWFGTRNARNSIRIFFRNRYRDRSSQRTHLTCYLSEAEADLAYRFEISAPSHFTFMRSNLTRDASYICNAQIQGWDSQRNQLTR